MKKVLWKSFLLFFCACYCANTYATVHTINVADFSFSPSTLTIQLGDTIFWKHMSGTHTTTSTTIPGAATPWNASITTGNPGFTYVPAVPGTYNYVCTPHQGMGMTASFTVTGSASVNNVSVAEFNIFPNPASTEIHVQSIAKSVEASLTDITGRKIPLQQISTSQGEKTFSTGGIADGIYFLSIHTPEADLTRKLVIRK
jgi:plastocyanin